jgi:flagellar biosynthesis/type III secretory pathway chaperone
MNQEQTYAATITMLENNRQQELQKMFPNQASLPTLSECIEHAEGTEKVKLTEIFSQLADIIEKIKEKNELNQQLIYQSLQFVNFSLSLFRPKQETVTYGPPNGKQPQLTQSTSMFNSEA